jgi:hypothetical protein
MRRRQKGMETERGQTIVLLAVALIALIAFVGLATDVALLYVAKSHLQRTIDSATLAAANRLPDQSEAKAAAYAFTSLHGYGFDPTSQPLEMDFPTTDPPRKIAAITGTVEVNLAFLKVIGWQSVQVTANGVAESAPVDLYLVLDLSHSMVYDTPRPWWWNYDEERFVRCPLTGCPEAYCQLSANDSWTQCIAYYCNDSRTCNPLDEHIKDSAAFFVSQFDARYDRVGVIGYDVEGSLAITLTDDFDLVGDTILPNIDAYLHPVQQPPGLPSNPEHLCTNIGDGLMYANHFMSLDPPQEGGEGGRVDSVWAVVLLTDGQANRYRDCAGCPPECATCPSVYCDPWTGNCPMANEWATDNAWVSWNNHKIVVYTIGYGSNFLGNPYARQLMINIADITDNGTIDGQTENFWAVPDEDGLREALREIADRIYTRLLQ